MPDEYYTLAENELKEVSEAYLAKHSIDSSVYSGDSDPIILRQCGAVITPDNVSGCTIPYFSNQGIRTAGLSALPETCTTLMT